MKGGKNREKRRVFAMYITDYIYYASIKSMGKRASVYSGNRIISSQVGFDTNCLYTVFLQETCSSYKHVFDVQVHF